MTENNNQTNKKNNCDLFEFDKLKMYFGEPYNVPCEIGEIKISQPTI